MSCSRIVVLFVYQLTLAFLVQKAFGISNCSNSGNFAANSPYGANLMGLLTTLYNQTPPTLFSQASVGQQPDQVYGLALCAAYMSSSNCQTCLQQAGNEIQNNCPNKKAAIDWNNWYGDCFLKYSDMPFFGQVDNQNKINYQNPNTASNPVAFTLQTNGLLWQLSNQSSASPALYSAGELQVYRLQLQKVYGLTQCTGDLTGSDCKECIDNLIATVLPSCCAGKEGGRIISGSCLVQFETFQFISS